MFSWLGDDFISNLSEYKVVAIGGGHGLSGISRQVRRYPVDHTAIVTPTDDGGVTRIFRTDYDVLSVGDFTLVVESLSGLSDDAIRGLSHRFSTGRFNGNSVRHNIFAGLCRELGANRAMEVIREIYQLPPNKRVYLPTLDKCTLCAELEDGTQIREETRIDTREYEPGKQIRRVFLDPDNPSVYEPSRRAILDADMIVLGPGSLYTSTIPSCLVPGIRDALRDSRGQKVYVCNVLTEPGSTHDYTVTRHLEALRDHGINIKTILVHVGGLTEDVIDAYAREEKHPVEYDEDRVVSLGVNIIKGNFVVPDGIPVRHSDNTGETLWRLLSNK